MKSGFELVTALLFGSLAGSAAAQNFSGLPDVSIIMEKGYKQDSSFVPGRGVTFALGEGSSIRCTA